MELKLELNIIFERLHRYVYDYYYQSKNEDWNVYTPYKKANINNKLKHFNYIITKFYNLLCPFFIGWRYNLPKERKYKRYGR